MHHIYQTEAIILSGRNSGEANRTVAVFARELGLVRGSAQGARLLVSKLRYGLQDFSFSRLALVRGRNGWRITSAVPGRDFYSIFKNEPQKLAIAGNVSLLLRRLLRGEEKNSELFDLVVGGFSFLETIKNGEGFLRNFEALIVLRILRNLGYVGKESPIENLVSAAVWSETVLETMTPFRPAAIKTINTSLKESHL